MADESLLLCPRVCVGPHTLIAFVNPYNLLLSTENLLRLINSLVTQPEKGFDKSERVAPWLVKVIQFRVSVTPRHGPAQKS